MTPGQKHEIDDMPYESMLRIWRHSPVGDKRFIGNTGDYFSKIMVEKRTAVGNEEYIAISKKVGWRKLY